MATMKKKNIIIDPIFARSLAELSLKSSDAASQDLDLFGIMWMEHINLTVGSREIATIFYLETLGCTQDGKNANIGMQQFHIGTVDCENPQVLNGCIGLTLPCLNRLRQRLRSAEEKLNGTKFDWDDNGDFLSVRCPWGNIFCIWGSETVLLNNEPEQPTADMPKMQILHLNVDKAMSVRPDSGNNGAGIRFVAFSVGPGKAEAIAKFYTNVFQSRCTISNDSSSVAVCAGPSVDIIFTHDKHLWPQNEESAKKAKGIHICIYITHFIDTYKNLERRGLIWTNPRFRYLDSCDNFKEALASRQFRFKSITDDNGKILELEHETRSSRHVQYFKSQPWSVC